MRKIIIASHHNLAKGMKDTVEYIMPDVGEITAITAYTTNSPVDKEIREVFAGTTEEDEFIIFTDLLGGSVNQNFVKYLSRPNVHLIAGMNLPVIMSCLLSLGNEPLDPIRLRQELEEGRQQIIYVNDLLLKQKNDQEDE